VAHIPERCTSAADGHRLWEISEQLTGVAFPKA